MIAAAPPAPPRVVLIVERDLSFATALANALALGGMRPFVLINPGLAPLYKTVLADPPDLVLFAQACATREAVRVIRDHAPAHAQALLLLDRAGSAPISTAYGMVDGFIWRDVGQDHLTAFVTRALRRRGSLARMRAAKAGS